MKKTISKIVTSILILSLISLPVLSGCAPKSVEKKPLENPYTFDYKTGKGNAGYFAQGDTYNTMKAASPFYGGARPFPSGRGAAYQKLRTAKVAQITKEAGALVKKTKALGPKAARLRQAYMSFLDEAAKEEPELKDYARRTTGRLSKTLVTQTIVEAEYASIRSNTKNAFADSFAGYAKVSKAVELGALSLEESQNLVGFAAAALSGLADHPSPKMKAARAKLDKEMAAFDAMRPDLEAVQKSMAKIDYGQRQLESADYYMAKEGLRFMAANLPALKAKARSLKAKGGLNQADIAFIRNYVEVMGQMRQKLATRLAAIDKKRLVPVKVEKRPAASLELVSPAYAAEELPYISGASQALSGALAADEAGGGISAWDVLRAPGKLWRGTKDAVGVVLDSAGVAVQSATTAGYGIYNGTPARDILQDMVDSARVIRQNYQSGISGASTFNTAGQYLEGAEKAAGATAEQGAEAVFGKGWTSWGVGGFTQLVVGTFTGLGKGIFKVAKTDATAAEIAGGAAEIGLSLIGGSKTIFNPAVLKTLGKEGLMTAAGGWTFLKGMAVNADKAAIRKAMAGLLSKSKLTQAEIAQLLRSAADLEAKEATTAILQRMRAELLAKMKETLKTGAKAGFAEGKKGAVGAWEGLFKKSYVSGLAGWRELIGDTLGKDMGEFLTNLAAGKMDGFLSGLIAEAMAAEPEPGDAGEGNGAAAREGDESAAPARKDPPGAPAYDPKNGPIYEGNARHETFTRLNDGREASAVEDVRIVIQLKKSGYIKGHFYTYKIIEFAPLPTKVVDRATPLMWVISGTHKNGKFEAKSAGVVGISGTYGTKALSGRGKAIQPKLAGGGYTGITISPFTLSKR